MLFSPPIPILFVKLLFYSFHAFWNSVTPFSGVSILRYTLIGRSLDSIILHAAVSPLVFKSCVLFCPISPLKPVIFFALINLSPPLRFKPIHRTMLIHAMITNDRPKQRRVKSRKNPKYIPAVRETIPYKTNPYQRKQNMKY